MAEMGTAAKLIEVAKAELGTIEGPKDNETKYGAYTKANFQPWCGSFVNWCGNEAGVKIPNTVYTPGGAAAFKKAGRWYDRILISRQMALIVLVTLELLLQTITMELSGVSKETLAQIKREANEMADKFQRNFVHTRRTRLANRFQSLALVALSSKERVQHLLLQLQQLNAQLAVSSVLPNSLHLPRSVSVGLNHSYYPWLVVGRTR